MGEIEAELSKIAEVSVLRRSRRSSAWWAMRIRDTPGVAARVFAALKDVNVRMISQGASLLNLSVVVDERRPGAGGEAAARGVLHRARSGGVWMSDKLALVGYGKMGRMLEQLAPEYGFDSRAEAGRVQQRQRRGFHGGELRGHRCGDRVHDAGCGRGEPREAGRCWAFRRCAGRRAGSSELERVKALVEQSRHRRWSRARTSRSA